MRLFCFPYSGCGATMFRRWPASIGAAEVIPLQLPGRENRSGEPHFATYERLADDLVAGIADYLDRPYAVFGHCGGALPCFETVLRIQERGLPRPTRCFVSSQVAPQDGPRGRFLRLSPALLEAELRGLFRALGTDNPPDELVEIFLEVLVADVEANKAYHRPAGRVDTPLTVIGWDRDVEVPHELMSGWAAWGTADAVLLHGEHYTFLDAPDDLRDVIAEGLGQPAVREDAAP
jgi:surfactin synthase thioesterase subunit